MDSMSNTICGPHIRQLSLQSTALCSRSQNVRHDLALSKQLDVSSKFFHHLIDSALFPQNYRRRYISKSNRSPITARREFKHRRSIEM